MRIDKYLSNMGVGSRKEVKEYIKKGYVLVNGETVTKGTIHIDENKDVVKFKDEDIEYKQYVYLMMNKPAGVVSATKDIGDTVIDLIDEKYYGKDIFPAGRLDKDTEGFILLTNDGKLAHNLLSPKKKVYKKYFAIVKNSLKEEDIKTFKNGVFLEGEDYLTMPAKLEIIDAHSANVYIQEGKYHQVKRMFHACDNEVTYLRRISFGNLDLDENLKLGEYRELTEEELIILEESTKVK